MRTTAFLSVFESKLEKLINKIKAEYAKPREERNRENLKALAKEAKKLRKLVREMQDQTAVQCSCPNCGHKFKLNR